MTALFGLTDHRAEVFGASPQARVVLFTILIPTNGTTTRWPKKTQRCFLIVLYHKVVPTSLDPDEAQRGKAWAGLDHEIKSNKTEAFQLHHKGQCRSYRVVMYTAVPEFTSQANLVQPVGSSEDLIHPDIKEHQGTLIIAIVQWVHSLLKAGVDRGEPIALILKAIVQEEKECGLQGGMLAPELQCLGLVAAGTDQKIVCRVISEIATEVIQEVLVPHKKAAGFAIQILDEVEVE